MSQDFIIVIFLVILISLSSALVPPVLHGNRIFDLYGENAADFSSLINQWTLYNIDNPMIYSFDSVTYLGGLGNLLPHGYIEKTYSSLPVHYTIYYYIKLTVFGMWTPGDAFQIYIDDNLVSSWDNIPTTSDSGILGLGGSVVPQGFNIVGSMQHRNTTLKIKIFSEFFSDALTASFGIKDIEILFSNGSNIDPKGTCTKHVAHTRSCDICGVNMYLNSSTGFCALCHSNCKECFGPRANQCYACQPNKYYSGYECLNCYSGCFSCSGPSQDQCITCDPGLILYWNNTCRSSCNTPYILRGSGQYKTCQTPCQPLNKYMLWNNTCIDTCEHPLVSEIEGQAKLCRFPCNNSNNEFAYWNRSCKSSCPYYQRNENGYRFCDPCQSSEHFLYGDDKCYPTCPTGYQRNDSKAKFCDFPCYGAQKYYNIQNNICLSECVYPSYVQNEVFCIFVSQNETEPSNSSPTEESKGSQQISSEIKGISSVLNTGGKAGMILANMNSFVNSGNPAAFSFLTLNEMLEYIKFLKIAYPPKLQQMLDLSEGSLFSLIPELPDEIRDKFPKHTLPVNFEKYDVDSSFFVNFWQQSITLLIICLSIIVCTLFEPYSKKSKFFNSILTKILQVLKWNYVIMLFTSYSGKIAFYGSFELRTIDIDAFAAALSLLLCIFSHIIACFVYIKITQVVKALHPFELKNKKINRIERLIIIKNKWKDYQVIFESFKEESLIQQAFLPLFIFRVTLFHAIISYFFEYPLAQAALITIIGILMLLYLTIVRPLKQKSDLVNYILQEVILLIVNLCILILAIFDHIGIDASTTRIILGDIVIYSNLSFCGIGLLFMILQTYVQLKSLYRIVKERCKQKKNEDKNVENRQDNIPIDLIAESFENTNVSNFRTENMNHSDGSSFLASLSNSSTITSQHLKYHNDLDDPIVYPSINQSDKVISNFLRDQPNSIMKPITNYQENRFRYFYKGFLLRNTLSLNKVSVSLEQTNQALPANNAVLNQKVEEANPTLDHDKSKTNQGDIIVESTDSLKSIKDATFWLKKAHEKRLKKSNM